MSGTVSTSPGGTKQFYTTTNTFETRFGYHRAVRRGQYIFVSGTTALNPETGSVDHPGDARAQALAAFATAVQAIKALGGEGLADVVRVKMFVGGCISFRLLEGVLRLDRNRKTAGR